MGGRYVGAFHHDKMQGKGTLFLKNGSEYIGLFREGKKHGKGFLRDPNNLNWEEEWDMNQLVSRKEVKGSFHPEVRLDESEIERGERRAA